MINFVEDTIFIFFLKGGVSGGRMGGNVAVSLALNGFGGKYFGNGVSNSVQMPNFWPRLIK